MAVLRNYISTIHDIHDYWTQPVLSPRQDAGQKDKKVDQPARHYH